MKLRNAMTAALADRNVDPEAWREALSILTLLLAPIAPHVTEEVWRQLGNYGERASPTLAGCR